MSGPIHSPSANQVHVPTNASCFILETAASPSLGPNWKRGFLDGAVSKRSAPRPARPAALTPGGHAVSQAPGEGTMGSTGTASSSAPGSDSYAFRGTVVENPVGGGTESKTVESSCAGPAVAAPRISRFKARRQGLE